MKNHTQFTGIRRMLAALLVLALVLGMMPAMALATGSEPAQEPASAAEERLLDMLQEQDGFKKAELLEAPYEAEETVTAIVTLDESVAADVQAHQQVQSAILGLMADAPEAAAAVSVKHDYYEVLNGFAVSVQYQYLRSIALLDGVESVHVEAVYEVPQEEVSPVVYKNVNSLEMVGADNTPYTGKGQVIAVIDSGVAVEHEAFQGAVPVDALNADALNKVAGKLLAGSGTLTAEDLRVDDKIPFAYDYADRDTNATPGAGTGLDHGTHVAGIAAANSGDKIRGVAPDAQIVAMKVFDDLTGMGYESNIIAAVEDAVTLGVDAINMSLGNDCGFSTHNEETYQKIYDSVRERGIVLNAAAGNAYSSALGNMAGNNLPAVVNPDSAMISAPAAFGASLAVASVECAPDDTYLLAGDGSKVMYKEATVAGKQMLAKVNGQMPYLNAGYGTMDEVTNVAMANDFWLSGKLLLIQRGSADGSALSFEDKANNAAAWGASGIIVYDNADSETLTDMGGITQTFYSVFISKADGEKLAAMENKTVTLSEEQTEKHIGPYRMSDFSSWGVTPDLKLKPEVTAPGGNIYSALLGNSYGTMSGTSMATPHMLGLSALAKEYITSDAKFARFTELQQDELVAALLMATATPLPRDDSYYSPRQQGAGLANIQNLVNAKAYLTVEGADAARPKAELGDGTGPYTFRFTVHNLTGEALTYTMDTAALSEEIVDGYFQQKSKNYTGNGVTVSYAGLDENGAVQVAANGETTLTVTITPEEGFKTAVAAAVNGTFLDGFVMLHAAEGSGSDLSLPFLAFYGDWSAAPVMDGALGGEEPAYMRPSYAYSSSNGNYLLGQNIFDREIEVDPAKSAISPNSLAAIFSGVATCTGLLRNTDHMTYTVTRKATGEIMQQDSFDRVKKSYYYQNTLTPLVTYAEAFMPYSPSFSSLTDTGMEVPEGWYTMDITAQIPGSQDVDTWSFDFYNDCHAPVVESYEIQGEVGEQTLVIRLSDNHYLSAVQLIAAGENSSVVKTCTFENPDRQENGRSYYEIRADYEEIIDQLTQLGERTDILMVDSFDYAVNYQQQQIVIQDTYPESVTLDRTEVTLMQGKGTGLTATLTPDTVTRNKITWSSSNPAVASVDAAGFVKALTPGTATITAQTEAENVSASCTVTVTEIPAEVGIVLDYEELLVCMKDSFQLTATLAAGLTGEIAWSSADSAIATVSETGLVTGVSTGKTTVTASVTVDGTTYAASCQVQVRPEGADDFVIDDDGVLVAYNGFRSIIHVPDGVTKIADGVFYLLPVEEVYIPASVEEIGEYAFQASLLHTVHFAENSKLRKLGAYAFVDTDLKELILPDSVRELGEGVCYNLYALETVSIPEGVTEIPAQAFSTTGNLKNISLPSTLKVIGENAFASCGVEELTLPEGLETIEACGFLGAHLREFIAPAGLKTIGNSAFNSAALTEVQLNEGLQSIGIAAFSNLNITRFTFPDSVTTVGANVLERCYSLKEVTVGAGITELSSPFAYTPSLIAIHVAEGSKSFRSDGGILFSLDGKTLVAHPAAEQNLANTGSYTVPAEVTKIADSAFLNLLNLRQIRFAEGSQLQEIGMEAFAYTSIPSFVAPEPLKTIGRNAFGMCESLTEIDLTHTETIGSYCFQYSADREPDLGDCLISMGNNAFAWSNALEIVTIPDTTTTVGSGAFINCPMIRQFNIGASLTDLGDSTLTGSNNLETINVSPNNPVYSSQDGILLRNGGKELILCAPKNPIQEFYAPATVESVANFGFRNVKTLRKVVFQEGLKVLGTSAFNGCSALTEIQLPHSLESIGPFAFSDNKFETLILGENVQSLDDWAFAFVDPLKHLVVEGKDLAIPSFFCMSNLETLYLGNGVTTVDGFGYMTSLQHVVLGENVSLSDWAFAGLTNTTFYAVPGTQGYAAAQALVAQLGAQNTLKDYAPLAVDVYASQDTVTERTKVTAAAVGGAGTLEYRFVTVDANGQETELQAYSAVNTVEVPVGETPVTVRAYVRDVTMLEVSGQTVLTLGGSASAFAITKQPENVTAYPNQNAVFTVETNRNAVTYQWQFSNTQGRTWANSSAASAHSATLEIPMMAYRDGQMYRCIVTDAEGTSLTSKAAVMRIISTATIAIVKQPTNVTAKAGEMAVFTVEATGKDLHYQWQFSNTNGATWGNSSSEGANTATLSVPMQAYRNGQMYRCVITNETGKVISKTAVMTLG